MILVAVLDFHIGESWDGDAVHPEMLTVWNVILQGSQ
jgi:hypothetical protein